jgi:GLPGLI family protein
MKATLLSMALLFLMNGLLAQHARFIFNGTIQYEKKVNMHALFRKQNLNKNDQTLRVYDDYKAQEPQFRTFKNELVFNNTSLSFTPIWTNEVYSTKFQNPFAEPGNVTYSEIEKNQYISQKDFFNEIFLVKDTLRKINWKYTDETREIAGFVCKRANAIIMDSIYVVAFYTTLIPIPGGPESFNGLPGMILGVALPNEHVTWFASRVVERSVKDDDLLIPFKGKIVSREELLKNLRALMKDGGAKTIPYFKALLL